ncbi:MAG: hypothetical protein V2A56_02155 [bacterium]
MPRLTYVILIALLGIVCSASAEWPVEGIEPMGQVGMMITVPDTSGGIWLIYDSSDPPPSLSEIRSTVLKGAKSTQLTQGFLRIQHIDSTGNKLLGEYGHSVIQDTTDSLAWLHGAVPTSDGGVIIAYLAATPFYNSDSTRRYYGLYGQRFSASGEPMWQKHGVPLAVKEGLSYFYSYDQYPEYVCCSDGMDGMWLLAYKDFTPEVDITNVHSDGTLNSNYSDLFPVGRGANIRTGDGVAICEDGKGGVFIGYVDDASGSFEFEHLSQNSHVGGGARNL